MIIKICQLLKNGKGIAAFIIKNFYQWKTNSRSKMIEAFKNRSTKKRKKKWRVKITKKIIKTMKIQILVIIVMSFLTLAKVLKSLYFHLL